jgi:hypothetical protein
MLLTSFTQHNFWGLNTQIGKSSLPTISLSRWKFHFPLDHVAAGMEGHGLVEPSPSRCFTGTVPTSLMND